MHGGNFAACSPLVKQHGAILGMQNAVQQKTFCTSSTCGGMNGEEPPVNAFLTIKRAKIA